MSDLIDREAAVDAIYHHFPAVSRTRVRTMLHEVPSAQPERKKGHWIVNADDESTISGSCSACGWQAHLYEDDVVGMNFCPNCGCRMGGDEK